VNNHGEYPSLRADKRESREQDASNIRINSILDRSPTPPYEMLQNTHRARAQGNVTTREQTTGGGGDTTENEPVKLNAALSKKSIEEALGVEVHEANQPFAKTFVRPEPPADLLEYPVIFNPRVNMMVAVSHPLYIGGGCVNGRLNLHIRGTWLDDIRLGRVSIDVAGVEGSALTNCFPSKNTDF
jgi:hypothetical protein